MIGSEELNRRIFQLTGSRGHLGVASGHLGVFGSVKGRVG